VTRGVKSVNEEEKNTLKMSLENACSITFSHKISMLLNVPCLKRTAQSALTCSLKYYGQTLGSYSRDNEAENEYKSIDSLSPSSCDVSLHFNKMK
jgi:hypothetical protein